MKGMLVLAVLAMPGLAQAQDWSVSGRIGGVSDYRDRGYTLSDGRPVLQGEATLSHTSGLYVGVWGSGIAEYGANAAGEGASTEVTLYAGWAGAIAGLDVDVGVWGNVYPGGTDVDYVEFPVQAGRSFGPLTLTAGAVWAPAQTGTWDEANTWVWGRVDYEPESWPVGLHAALGHEDGGFAPDGKTDWRLGVSAPLAGFTLALDWVDSDTEDSAAVVSLFRDFAF
ncbi:TorF family putative porin [Brevundimonas sp. FT23042]|uniref:TorF family putative porin n=1 Tax=Brevundimonas sp. FT23042 TaxID=3393749 RepID=UPI003B5873CF